MLREKINRGEKIIIPKRGIFATDDDSLSRKRKELAEKLKRGQKVSVTPSGTAVDPNSPEAQQGGKTLFIPDGKLAICVKGDISMVHGERSIDIPVRGIFATDDAALSRKRKELAEKLKKGQKVSVTPSGTAVDPNSPEAQQEGKTLFIPDGKLASGYYWYNRDPGLFEAEKAAMRESFPHFQLDKLDDGRLCWVGTLAPCGANDIVWTLMAVYDHNHPSNENWGGSVKIYSLDPALEELNAQVGGRGLPHILRDGGGNLYMCTARKEDVDSGNVITSASASLRWAVKWTFAVTCWLHGDVGDEIFAHTF